MEERLAKLANEKEEIEAELAKLESQIASLEKTYFEQAVPGANIVSGWRALLSTSNPRGPMKNYSSSSTPGRKSSQHIKNSDRIFSLSSSTSPISLELAGNSEPNLATDLNALKDIILANRNIQTPNASS